MVLWESSSNFFEYYSLVRMLEINLLLLLLYRIKAFSVQNEIIHCIIINY